jgi:hypothetical protein
MIVNIIIGFRILKKDVITTTKHVVNCSCLKNLPDFIYCPECGAKNNTTMKTVETLNANVKSLIGEDCDIFNTVDCSLSQRNYIYLCLIHHRYSIYQDDGYYSITDCSLDTKDDVEHMLKNNGITYNYGMHIVGESDD